MRRPRFTIAGLLVIVLIVAVALAALREANDLWDGCVFSLVALALLTAVLSAVHRRERCRAYWLGFCVFGWAYLTASLIPTVESRLPTSKGLAYLDSKLSGRAMVVTWAVTTPGGSVTSGSPFQMIAVSPGNNPLAANQQRTIRLWSTATGRLLAGPNGTTEDFVRIGHSIITLILALVGGNLSLRLYALGRPGRDRGPDLPGPSPAESDRA